MNELIIRPVDFLGDQLIAIKNEETGKIYTGVSYICKGIGFTKGQKDRQVKNIQEDEILNRGCLKFEAGVIDPNNEVLAIELDFLPLWLAKISITPNMKEEQPQVAKKLVNYQLKAKDILAQTFIHNKPTCIEDILISSLQEMKAIKGDVEAIKQANVETKEEIQGIRDAVTLEPNQWRKDTAALINKIANKLGGFEHIKPVREEAYRLLNNSYGVNLKIRLLNKQKKMALEGTPKYKVNKINYLDVIAEDKKLINGYINIISKLAIKYGVGGLQNK
ncbi:phage antirepressor N-terminal domain-containing protein [Clostridium taeniosporum]|nr:phage antirepressor N-terminal domain-containing protein [Clostridium taeniosporum]